MKCLHRCFPRILNINDWYLADACSWFVPFRDVAFDFQPRTPKTRSSH